MMTDELILHLWEAFVGDETLKARPLNDDDKIAFANAVLNADRPSQSDVQPRRRRERSELEMALADLEAVITEVEGWSEWASNVGNVWRLEGVRGALAIHLSKEKADKRIRLSEKCIQALWDEHAVPFYGKTCINPIVFARLIEAAHGIPKDTTP